MTRLTLAVSIESLRLNLVRRVIAVEPSLLERMVSHEITIARYNRKVRVALLCPLFTDRQKMTVVQTARIPCPEDLAHLLVPQQPKVTTPRHREVDGLSVGSSLLSSPGCEGPTATFVAELHDQIASAKPRDDIYVDPEVDPGRPSAKPQKRFDPFVDEEQWPRLGSTICSSHPIDTSKPSRASFPPPPQQAPPRLQNQASHPTQLKLYRERLRQEQESKQDTNFTPFFAMHSNPPPNALYGQVSQNEWRPSFHPNALERYYAWLEATSTAAPSYPS